MSGKRTLPGPEVVPMQNGKLLEWVSSTVFRNRETAAADAIHPGGLPTEWRPNEPFRARMRLSGIERGRSAARFVWADDEGRTWPMFMADAFNLMASAEGVRGGEVDIEWIVIKRGQNFGISPVSRWREGMGA